MSEKLLSVIVLPQCMPLGSTPFMIRSDLQMAYVSGFISVPDSWIAALRTPKSSKYSRLSVSIPPEPHAGSYSVIILGRSSFTGSKTKCAKREIASLGVKCSPASSLFSSLNRRSNSSKTVPIPTLVNAGKGKPSGSIVFLSVRLILGSVIRSIMESSLSLSANFRALV